MPPYSLTQYTSRGLDTDSHTGMVSLGEAKCFNSSTHTGSSNMALPIILPIIFGVGLSVAVVLMPKGFFWNFASDIGIGFSRK
jgi:hypothetical protein